MAQIDTSKHTNQILNFMKTECLQLKAGKISVLGISIFATTLLILNGCSKDNMEIIPTQTNENALGVSCKSPTSNDLPCGGFRTQTQGGWGASAHGNNPGKYLQNNFDAAFPKGLIVGRYFKITFTNAQAITNYLPAGGQPAVLSADYVNPVNLKNNLASQLITLTLSVQFDLYDPGFSSSTIHLRDLIIANGVFKGKTIAELLTEANNVLGGRSSTYTASQIADALTQINENFDDGTKNNNFLVCPESANTGGGGGY